MKLLLKLSLLLTLCGSAWPSLAQSGSGYWFEEQGGRLLLRSAAGDKPVTQLVTLPNGTRLDHRTGVATLPDGTQRRLREGETVSLNGIISAPAGTAGPSVTATSTKPERPSRVATTALAPAPASAPNQPTAASAATPLVEPATSAAFSYVAPVPVGGRLRGVVELGASGFNSFIVQIDPEKRWQLRKAEFGNSLVMENLATEDDVRQGLKAYIGKMLNFGVGARDIFFVVSSGAMKAAVTPRLIASLKSLGYVVSTVSPDREGALALRAALPAPYASEAFVVDMGSANTKISWLSAGQPTSREAYGAKYYEDKTPDAVVTAAVREQAQKVPIGLRRTCFMLGGVPYELAKKVRKGKERYTVLDLPSAYGGPEAKLRAGLLIYKAIADATGCQRFVFDWDANFTIGYLLSRP